MRICAHRGASYYEPENTLRAFRRALEMGADRIEVDVRLTADGHIIALHDETVDRTTNGSGYARDMTLEEIRRLDAGNGERIPTLREIIDLVRDRADLLIDVKDLGMEDKLAETILNEDLIEDAVFISSPNIIRRLKEICNEFQICPYYRFVADDPIDMNAIKRLKVDWVYMRWTKINRRLVSLLHRSGASIFASIPDDVEAEKFDAIIGDLYEMETDELVTGRPDLAYAYISRRRMKLSH
ncbi:glycerophosphodiester phosphodiesterase [Candidatus Bathyarchaeota archaeon]|nr:glycerophosphodiester phosphodiesterase [Candidatus Bathyarchaeota archaeon]